MKIVSFKKNCFVLKILNLEDLWILTQFIAPEDVVYGKDRRKVTVGDFRVKQVVKMIYVELCVRRAVFEDGVLKVLGEMLNDTEFTAKGSSHTLNFKVGDVVKVEKEEVLDFEKQLIESSQEVGGQENFLLLIDKDEMIVCLFQNYDYKVLAHFKGLGSKKYFSQNIDEEEEKYKLFLPIFRTGDLPVIIASPFHFKDKLASYFKAKKIDSVQTISWQDIREEAVPRLLKNLHLKGLIQSSQIAVEEEVVSKFLEVMNTGGAYTYGFSHVREKVLQSNVKQLIVTTKFMEEMKENGKYYELQDLFLQVQKSKSRLSIINSKFESGKIIDGLGGICALLYY